jgi:hypothetical protein
MTLSYADIGNQPFIRGFAQQGVYFSIFDNSFGDVTSGAQDLYISGHGTFSMSMVGLDTIVDLIWV